MLIRINYMLCYNLIVLLNNIIWVYFISINVNLQWLYRKGHYIITLFYLDNSQLMHINFFNVFALK